MRGKVNSWSHKQARLSNQKSQTCSEIQGLTRALQDLTEAKKPVSKSKKPITSLTLEQVNHPDQSYNAIPTNSSRPRTHPASSTTRAQSATSWLQCTITSTSRCSTTSRFRPPCTLGMRNNTSLCSKTASPTTRGNVLLGALYSAQSSSTRAETVRQTTWVSSRAAFHDLRMEATK